MFFGHVYKVDYLVQVKQGKLSRRRDEFGICCPPKGRGVFSPDGIHVNHFRLLEAVSAVLSRSHSSVCVFQYVELAYSAENAVASLKVSMHSVIGEIEYKFPT